MNTKRTPLTLSNQYSDATVAKIIKRAKKSIIELRFMILLPYPLRNMIIMILILGMPCINHSRLQVEAD